MSLIIRRLPVHIVGSHRLLEVVVVTPFFWGATACHWTNLNTVISTNCGCLTRHPNTQYIYLLHTKLKRDQRWAFRAFRRRLPPPQPAIPHSFITPPSHEWKKTILVKLIWTHRTSCFFSCLFIFSFVSMVLCLAPFLVMRAEPLIFPVL